mgnify:CR=1 FL=1
MIWIRTYERLFLQTDQYSCDEKKLILLINWKKVTDGDYLRNGELYLKHWYEDIELDVKYLEKVMPYIYQLWGRGVHMETLAFLIDN